jgi:hypothetical protein
MLLPLLNPDKARSCKKRPVELNWDLLTDWPVNKKRNIYN